MRHRRVAVRAALAAVLALGAAFPGSEARAAEPDPQLAAGFDHVYNLDYVAAIAAFRDLIAARPDDPAPHRAVSAAVWLQLLFQRGAALTDSYLAGSMYGPSGEFDDPPEHLVDTFEHHVAQAIALSEAAIDRNPDDPDGHYELGVAVALDASYAGTIRRQPFQALRSARRAYLAHEHVLELDPSHHDAKLLLGIYRYIVSVMPRPFRWVAYLVGFDGGKEEALRMLADAARRSTEVRQEAQFALALLYNREREYRRAERVLANLRRAVPRNRLLWLETASIWLRSGRPAMAELILSHGFHRLQADERPRMLGEDAIWHLKRGATRVALGQTDEARIDLLRAARGGATAWVIGQAHLELGKAFDLKGNHQQARGHYVRSRRLCGEGGDRRCARAAATYVMRPYTGPG